MIFLLQDKSSQSISPHFKWYIGCNNLIKVFGILQGRLHQKFKYIHPTVKRESGQWTTGKLKNINGYYVQEIIKEWKKTMAKHTHDIWTINANIQNSVSYRNYSIMICQRVVKGKLDIIIQRISYMLTNVLDFPDTAFSFKTQVDIDKRYLMKAETIVIGHVEPISWWNAWMEEILWQIRLRKHKN